MADWAALATKLKELRRNNIGLRIWWRDDDAIQMTNALEQLQALSQKLGVPAHLAVIPALVKEPLPGPLLVHGWAHENNAATGTKKTELTDHDGVRGKLEEALRRVMNLSAEASPVLVPPWNRIDDTVVRHLHTIGYRGLSTFKPRRAGTQHGLRVVNTHIDPIDWRGARSLIAEDELLAQVVGLLESCLQNPVTAAEPLGYLTHHLVHDQAIWAFSERLLATLLDGGATPSAPFADLRAHNTDNSQLSDNS